MGCYIWYSEDGPAGPSPLLAPLLCGFNVAIKGLKSQHDELVRSVTQKTTNNYAIVLQYHLSVTPATAAATVSVTCRYGDDQAASWQQRQKSSRLGVSNIVKS